MRAPVDQTKITSGYCQRDVRSSICLRTFVVLTTRRCTNCCTSAPASIHPMLEMLWMMTTTTLLRSTYSTVVLPTTSIQKPLQMMTSWQIQYYIIPTLAWAEAVLQPLFFWNYHMLPRCELRIRPRKKNLVIAQQWCQSLDLLASQWNVARLQLRQKRRNKDTV